MGKLFGRKDDSVLLGAGTAPAKTMGFSKEYSSLLHNFIIRKYDFSDLAQIKDIKKQLLGRRILILDAKEILKNIDISELKRGIEDIKTFLRNNGGSMGRLGNQYLILTPNAHIKISN